MQEIFPTNTHPNPLPCLARSLDVGSNTVGSIGPAAKLGWLTTGNSLEQVTHLVVWYTGVADLRSVSVVGVDPSKYTSVLGVNVIHDNSSRFTIVAAVSAGAVELAEGVDVEVLDADGTETIVLEDLVGSGFSPTTIDVGGTGVGFESSSVYTHYVSLRYRYLVERYDLPSQTSSHQTLFKTQLPLQ